MKKDYYVYVHKRNDTSVVFYVGHGRYRRAWKKSARTSGWSKVVNEAGGYNIEFLAKGLTKQEAISLENSYLQTPDVDWALVNVNPAQVVIEMDRQELRDYFYIDPSSPSGLRWKASFSRKNKSGDVAGNFYGYWKVGFKNKVLRVHRIIAALAFDDFNSELVVNHKDCNPKNNDLSNLEVVTQAENCKRTKYQIYNLPKQGSASGILGITRILNKPYAVTFVVRWEDSNGARHIKKFNTNKFENEEQARLAAIEFQKTLK